MSERITAAPEDAGRRRFIGAAAALTTVMLAPGVTLIAAPVAPSASAAQGSRRYGLLIDANRCAQGCDACVTACSDANGWKNNGQPTDPQWLRKIEVRDPRSGVTRSLPMMCQHCGEPPCVDVCPTGASFKRADGIVLVDRHICIGCRYCMMACPYKARSFVHENLSDQRADVPRGKGTVESCTLCAPRVDRGGQPACVEACARSGAAAMLFGDINDPASAIGRELARLPVMRVRADLGLDPGVMYQGI